MKLFEIGPDKRNWGRLYEYQIEASHKWGLPGLRCSVCDTWATVGPAYPQVDVSGLPNASRYSERSPVSSEELEILRKPLSQLLPPGSDLPPGTDLGPLIGRATGQFGDFAWCFWWMLARPATVSKLKEENLNLPAAVPAQLRFKSQDSVSLLEFAVECQVNLDPESLSMREEECSVCGRKPWRLLNGLVVKKSSIPENLDLFKPREFPTRILATERFADVIRSLRFTDITFNEVTVM